MSPAALSTVTPTPAPTHRPGRSSPPAPPSPRTGAAARPAKVPEQPRREVQEGALEDVRNHHIKLPKRVPRLFERLGLAEVGAASEEGEPVRDAVDGRVPAGGGDREGLRVRPDRGAGAEQQRRDGENARPGAVVHHRLAAGDAPAQRAQAQPRRGVLSCPEGEAGLKEHVGRSRVRRLAPLRDDPETALDLERLVGRADGRLPLLVQDLLDRRLEVLLPPQGVPGGPQRACDIVL
eukprot:CAMPEP_0177595032 /NCGR_PEP_ID=MMETSP0419_2-20121207/10120_1 /TAXON_ID=582737 /ORGANISM="Tetraselmis sp., Strain GSL018" /LENGTH=235 /DNA_ID=CAMNT_0019086425 /DNA_START=954 /DNA_END=1658 /DNA_ORIENTATION=+